jgi:hypothetical protein
MFHPLAIDLINGPNVDRPANALILTCQYHGLFTHFNTGFDNSKRLLHHMPTK